MRAPSPAAWRAVLPIVLFALLSAWTADALKGSTPFLDWFYTEPSKPSSLAKSLAAAIFLAAFTGSAIWLYRIRNAWRVPPRLLNQRVGGQAHKVLVMGLSPPPEWIKGFDLGDGKALTLHKDATGDLLKIHSLPDALDDMKKHNWQQSLRAIHPHAQQGLELLIVVPSDGATGSGHFTLQFEQWIKHYQRMQVWKEFDIKVAAAVDYENFADLQGRYLETIRLAKGSGFQESDVVIDVTAGFKTNSIAGAMVTLATEAHFQYIQTVPNFERITYTVEAEGTTDPG